MSLTKQERAALRELRRYVTLQRAGLDIPGAMGSMGEGEDGEGTTVFELYRLRAVARNRGENAEPAYHRPLAEPDSYMQSRVMASTSDLFTNDVAEALKVYTESWVLPLIDALLDESGRDGKRSHEASATLRSVAGQ
jgi:hypothetical protein